MTGRVQIQMADKVVNTNYKFKFCFLLLNLCNDKIVSFNTYIFTYLCGYVVHTNKSSSVVRAAFVAQSASRLLWGPDSKLFNFQSGHQVF